MKLYKITWRDSEIQDDPWHSLEDLKNFLQADILCESVGYLIMENDLYILLVSDLDGTERYGRPMKIPKKAIVKKSKL